MVPALDALDDEAPAVLDDAQIERALHRGLPVFTTDRPDAALRLRTAPAAS